MDYKEVLEEQIKMLLNMQKETDDPIYDVDEMIAISTEIRALISKLKELDREIWEDITALNIKNIPTCELVEELKSREGVASHMINVNEPFTIIVDGEEKNLEEAFGFDVETGPAIVIVVID